MGGRRRAGDGSWQVPGQLGRRSVDRARRLDGGWTAAVFDDVIGRTVRATGVRSVTAHLGVDYPLPVPVEHDVVVRADVTGRDGRRRRVEAVLELADTGEVLAQAAATMVVVDDSHYNRHRARMQERAGRLAGTERRTARRARSAHVDREEDLP